MGEDKIIPYKEKEGSKKVQVAEMFDKISGRYDFLNHLLSLGIDRLWRKRAIKLLKGDQPKVILDVATGTGDFAFEALSLKPEKIYGIDISKGMLKEGMDKVRQRKKDLVIDLIYGDSEDIPMEDETFDAITVAFGVRNFENLERGLKEMRRVLKKDGKIVVLEFSKPKLFPIKQLYQFYFNRLLPKIGGAISNDSAAYTYLPESVNAFPEGKAFESVMRKTGFKPLKTYPQFFGIATIYLASQ